MRSTGPAPKSWGPRSSSKLAVLAGGSDTSHCRDSTNANPPSGKLTPGLSFQIVLGAGFFSHPSKSSIRVSRGPRADMWGLGFHKNRMSPVRGSDDGLSDGKNLP